MNKIFSSTIVRMILYAAIVVAGTATLFYFFPDVQSLLYGEPAVETDAFGAVVEPYSYGPKDSRVRQALIAFSLLLASLVFVAPVAWIYMVTKRQEGFDKTFVQVLVLLPVVVAAVVRVVRGDLALAFALAGIVAAIRFRTTLKDLKNAVFAFAAIGIGLAAGTGAFMLAGVLAFVFSIVAYLLWKLNVGYLMPSHVQQGGAMRLAEALVSGEERRSIAIGSSPWTDELEPHELPNLHKSIERLNRFVRGDALIGKKNYNLLLLAFTKDVEAGSKVVEKTLDKYASRWCLVESIAVGADTTALEYLVRPKKGAQINELVDRLGIGEDGATVVAAQLKSVEGLRENLA